MSSLRPKRKREHTVDVTAWVLGTIIVLLATLDLLVWATMRDAPNPISKFITEQASWISTPTVRHAAR